MRILRLLIVIIGLILTSSTGWAQSFWQASGSLPNVTDTVFSITVHPNASIFIGTSGSAVLVSADSGNTFATANVGFVFQRVFDVKVSSLGYLFAGADSSGVFRSIDNGSNWTFTSPIINAHAILTTSGGFVFAGTNNGEIYRSSDAGYSWQLIGSTNYYKITSFAQNGSALFCGTMGGGIFKSTDNGNNWVQIVTTTPQIYNVNNLHVSRRYELFAVTSNKGIFKSTDNGLTWLQINTGLGNTNVTSIISNASGDLFAGTYGNGVYRSTDFGSTWSSVTSGMTDFRIRSLAVDSFGYVYAGARNVVYRSLMSTELSTPVLVSPLNGDDSTSASPQMIWRTIDSASFYTLQISENPNFTSTVVNVTSITDTSYLASGLEYEKWYYWRVQALNSSAISNWSPIWSFKTVIASPDIPVPITPTSNDTTGDTPLFRWSKSPRAARYWFQLALDRNFTVLTREDSTITDSTYIFGPLVSNTKFFWRVRAKNVGWTSDWSRIDSFTTLIQIPTPPNPLSPLFGATSVPINTTFRWSNSTHASTYRLQISTDPSFATFFYNDSTLTDTSTTVSSMANSTTYYWRVNAKNVAGESSFSSIYYFTTIITAPATPTLVSPNDADSNITTTPIVYWNSSIGAVHYQLQVSTTSGFAAIINDTSWVSDTTALLNILSNNTTYYWRVRARNAVGYSSWATARSFKTFANASVPSSWSFISNTGNNSSISIPVSINPSIGQNKIKNGDAIGVFFLRNDSMFCAGYTIWNYTSNNGIIIWGDNSQTPIKDGFSQNEMIRFKIWDSQLRKEYPAHVKFAGGKTNYFMNEYYTVDSLKGTTRITHNITLNQGWNLISTFAQPQDSTMDSVCSGIRSAMVLMKDGMGRFYWPDYNIRQITHFNFRQGYQIFMLAPATLTITGSNVLWDTTKIRVIPGWNIISYLRQSPMRVDSALARIISKVVLVKNDSGQFFWNEFGVNTIGTMKPGIGYQIYMSDSATFSYPYGLVPLNLLSKKSFAAYRTLNRTTHFVLNSKKSINNSLLFFESPTLSDGDEVGIFSSTGLLIGSGTIENGRAFMTIYGDDDMTKDAIEGAGGNEPLYVKIFDKSKGSESLVTNLSVTIGINGNEKSNKLLYRPNTIYKISEKIPESIPEKFALEQNYPNPFNPTTKISFSIPVKTKIALEIYNTLGQMVKKLIDNIDYDPGTYKIDFNAAGLASGIYYYRLKTDFNSDTKKMLLLR